jgi:hypothetical protein
VPRHVQSRSLGHCARRVVVGVQGGRGDGRRCSAPSPGADTHSPMNRGCLARGRVSGLAWPGLAWRGAAGKGGRAGGRAMVPRGGYRALQAGRSAARRLNPSMLAHSVCLRAVRSTAALPAAPVPASASPARSTGRPARTGPCPRSSPCTLWASACSERAAVGACRCLPSPERARFVRVVVLVLVVQKAGAAARRTAQINRTMDLIPLIIVFLSIAH